MYRYFIIFISLFVTVSVTDAQTVADSLYAAGDYTVAALEYEREVFEATSRQQISDALRGKAACHKAMGQYAQAAETWQRVAPSETDVLQYVLCLYLSGQYDKAALAVEEAVVMEDTVDADLLLVYILSLNELNKYEEAYSAASEMAKKIGDESEKVIDSIYSHAPKMKSEKTAQWLSIVPGLGHLYAGYPVEAVSAFLFNAGALAFGVWQVLEKCYFTAYFGGAGLLASSYPGLFGSAVTHVRKTNFKRTDSFNRQCKESLLRLIGEHR